MIVMSSPLESNAWQPLSNHLFLEHAEGYVKVLEKSTFPSSTVRGVLNTVPCPPGVALRITLRKTGISPPRVIFESRVLVGQFRR
jgi:hypothetical protein